MAKIAVLHQENLNLLPMDSIMFFHFNLAKLWLLAHSVLSIFSFHSRTCL